MLYFNPGCAMQLYKESASQEMFAFLKSQFPDITFHDICCHFEPKLPAGAKVVTVCAGCDRRFRNLYEGISTVSLWEILDQSEHFPLPNYQGMSISIHDPCPVRKQPDTHQAVRNLLAKMNMEVLEAEHHGQNSICCGDSFYPKHDVSKVEAEMHSRALTMPTQDVCVYCVSCIGAMDVGGKTPRHLLDLVLGKPTSPMGLSLPDWHSKLDDYRQKHST